RLEHAVDVPLTGRTRRRVGAMRRASATTEHRRDSTGERVLDLLRADEMNMRVDRSRGDDAPLSCDDFRGCANHHSHGHTMLDSWITRVSDADDSPSLHANIRLHHALHGIKDQCIS